ncbi:MAG: c-type cytochrome domain-containing protein [Chitinophagaceae bacterium]
MLLDIANEWMNYLGHFHPVIVHLPIGILFVAFILELVAWKSGQAALLNQGIAICLAAGCTSAVVACIFGWFLSLDGGYEEKLLNLHLWMGILVAVIAGGCWIIKKKYGRLLSCRKLYTSLLLILFLVLTLTGHLGGSMTHGEDYLTAGLPRPFANWFGIQEKMDTVRHVKKIIANLQEAVVYTDLVQPVLDEKCYSCHSSKKIKGALRMDATDLLFKGGKHGVVIKPGNAAESEIMIRVLLPKDDDKRMPPKDKKAITKDEIGLLQWWIKNGADTKKKVRELPPDAAMLPALAVLGGPAPDTIKITPLSRVFDKTQAAAKQADIDALVKLGILVSPVAKGKQLLEISCINYTGFNNSKMPLLLKLADNIAWLRLDNTAITDEALTQMAQLKNLVRLNLGETNISSPGIAKLKSLPNLEYINIINTKVNDDGLLALSGIASLKHIYCWGSQVTQKGIAIFKQKNPGVQLEAGNLLP